MHYLSAWSLLLVLMVLVVRVLEVLIGMLLLLSEQIEIAAQLTMEKAGCLEEAQQPPLSCSE